MPIVKIIMARADKRRDVFVAQCSISTKGRKESRLLPSVVFLQLKSCISPLLAYKMVDGSMAQHLVIEEA